MAEVTVTYLCIGHPGWPDPLVQYDQASAQRWFDEHVERHPNIRVDKVISSRERLFPQPATSPAGDS